MSSLIRKTVSKKKRRYQKNGFDLDLSYITDQLIAMGFPSESVEGVYRNPFKEVFRFLEQMHKDHYKVYNLCSERGYDISKFHNRVEVFPFDDHNAPPLEMIVKFCKNVNEWLSQHEKNVAVIHCKAGKGRTGVMVTAYMLFSGEWKNAQDALDFYAAMRTYNKKGVTIPSQIRYVKYTATIVNNFKSQLPEPRTLLLNTVELYPVPKISNVTDIRFSVYVNKTLIYTFKSQPTLKNPKKKLDKKTPRSSKTTGEDETEREAESLLFECTPIPIFGDIKIDFAVNETFGSDRLFAFWFHTSLVESTGSNQFVLEVKKEELDKACKDKSHKTYKENFRVIATFSGMEPNAKIAPLNIERKPSISNLDGVLNGMKVWTSSTKRSPCEVAEDLLQQLSDCILETDTKVINADSKLGSIKDSNSFKAFAISSCELQQIVLDELPLEEQVCFWINTFNLLSIHSTIVEGNSASTMDKKIEQMKKAKYNIGGFIFSLFEIEFCMIRHKMTIPEFFGCKPLASDQRSFFAVSRTEPRINFALNPGTVSGASMRIYHLATIFEDLEAATRTFLQEKITLDEEKKEITLPKQLEWYYKDFAKSPEKMLRSLIVYLPENCKKAVSDDYKVIFQEYQMDLLFNFKHIERSSGKQEQN